jgi:hypothetical protein
VKLEGQVQIMISQVKEGVILPEAGRGKLGTLPTSFQGSIALPELILDL